jgi:hypothetical protein
VINNQKVIEILDLIILKQIDNNRVVFIDELICEYFDESLLLGF